MKWSYNTDTGLLMAGEDKVPPAVKFQLNGYNPRQSIEALGNVGDEKKKAAINTTDKDDTKVGYDYPSYSKGIKAGINMGNLTQAEYIALEQTIAETRVALLGHRRLLPVDKVLPTQQFYQKVNETWGGSAEVIDKGVTIPEDSSIMTYVDIPILKYALAVRIHREDYNAATLARAVRYITRKVQEREGQVCYESHTLPDVDGLIDDAGNTAAAASVWSGAPGTSLPFTDLQDLAAKAHVDGIQGTNFVFACEYANWAEGNHRLDSAGDGGIPFALSTGLLKDAFWDPSCPNATALLVDVGPDAAVLGVSEDLTIIVGDEDPSNQSRLVTCHIRSSPIIVEPNAVCSLTSV